MSYRNPAMYSQADPAAFSKGFESAFEKQQSAFDQDLKQREALAAEAEETMRGLYDKADLGIINGIDSTFNNALQDMLNSVIENGDFSNASAGEQAKMLQDLRFKKTAMQRIGEIVGVDQENWDLRNDPKISAFRNALLKGETPEITSEGMNLKIKGSFGEITLDDIANTRLLEKSGYQETLDGINDDFGERYSKAVTEAFKQGKTPAEIQALKNQYKETYASLIKNSDPDFKSYLKFNVGKSEDENMMIDNMFNQIDSKMIDPSLIYNQPQAEFNYALDLGSTLARDLAADVPGFLNNIGLENAQMDAQGNITYTYYNEVDGEQQPAQGRLNINSPADVNNIARNIFDKQYPKEMLSGQNRTEAYNTFYRQLVPALKGQLQSMQQQQANTPAPEPTVNPREQFRDTNPTILDGLEEIGLEINQENIDFLKKELSTRQGSISQNIKTLKKEREDRLKEENRMPGKFRDPSGTVISFNMDDTSSKATNLTAIQKRFFEDNNIPKTYDNLEVFKNFILKGGNIGTLSTVDRRDFDKYKK